MTSICVFFTAVQEGLIVKRGVSALYLLFNLRTALSSLLGVCSGLMLKLLGLAKSRQCKLPDSFLANFFQYSESMKLKFKRKLFFAFWLDLFVCTYFVNFKMNPSVNIKSLLGHTSTMGHLNLSPPFKYIQKLHLNEGPPKIRP